jgi:hypothetical protein
MHSGVQLSRRRDSARKPGKIIAQPSPLTPELYMILGIAQSGMKHCDGSTIGLSCAMEPASHILA